MEWKLLLLSVHPFPITLHLRFLERIDLQILSCAIKNQKGAKSTYLGNFHRPMHTLNAMSFPEESVGAFVSGCLPNTVGLNGRSHIFSRVTTILATRLSGKGDDLCFPRRSRGTSYPVYSGAPEWLRPRAWLCPEPMSVSFSYYIFALKCVKNVSSALRCMLSLFL